MRRQPREHGLPAWFQQYLRSLYSSATASICCKDGKTRPIPVRRGLLQGCPLSPVLWNMVFDPAVCQELHPLGLALRAFADDVAMSSRNLDTIRAAVATFEATILPMGVSTNPAKCVVCKIVDGMPVPMGPDEEIYIGGADLPHDRRPRPPSQVPGHTAVEHRQSCRRASPDLPRKLVRSRHPSGQESLHSAAAPSSRPLLPPTAWFSSPQLHPGAARPHGGFRQPRL